MTLVAPMDSKVWRIWCSKAHAPRCGPDDRLALYESYDRQQVTNLSIETLLTAASSP